MILKNIGSKIINVGSTILMPEDEMEISKEIAETPSILALVNMKFLSIENGKKVEEKAKKESVKRQPKTQNKEQETKEESTKE